MTILCYIALLKIMYGYAPHHSAASELGGKYHSPFLVVAIPLHGIGNCSPIIYVHIITRNDSLYPWAFPRITSYVLRIFLALQRLVAMTCYLLDSFIQ